MSIHLTLRAVTQYEWRRVSQLPEVDVSAWLFAQRKPQPSSIQPEQMARLSGVERMALINQMFSCCEVYPDRAVMDYRWCKLVDVFVGSKYPSETSNDASCLSSLLSGSFDTGIPSVYGTVRVFPNCDIEATLSRIAAFDRNDVEVNDEDLLANEELRSLRIESIPNDLGLQAWYTIDRIQKMFRRFNDGGHLFLEYSH